MNSEEIKKRLISQSTPDDQWIKEAKLRRDNQDWLNLSAKIAVHILLTLRKRGMTQKDLAMGLNLSPQYVNKIVKGKENLTLETITKLEKALDISLIDIASHSTSQSYDFESWGKDNLFYSKMKIVKSEMNLSSKPDCIYNSPTLKIA